MSLSEQKQKPGADNSSSGKVFEYLAGLGQEVLSELYKDEFTTIAVFRSLPEVAKQYIMRVLFLDEPTAIGTIQQWARSSEDALRMHHGSMARLFELGIMQRVQDGTFVQLSESFRDQLRELVAHGNTKWQQLLHFLVGEKETGGSTQAQAAVLTRGQQSDVHQQKLVHGLPPTHIIVKRRLQTMGLMQDASLLDGPTAGADDEYRPEHEGRKRKMKSGELEITSKGFVFLFKSVYDQVWDLLISQLQDTTVLHAEYAAKRRKTKASKVGKAGSTKIDAQEVLDSGMTDGEQAKQRAAVGAKLRFIFQLSFLKLGSGYRMPESREQRDLVENLHQVGLLYKHSTLEPNAAVEQTFFFPTHLVFNIAAVSESVSTESNPLDARASHASSSSSSSSSSAFPTAAAFTAPIRTDAFSDHVSLVVESSFKIYAFTNSNLHKKLIGLFARIDYTLPGMVSAVLTKRSLTNAFKKNLTAAEIIGYLSTYAHPEMKKAHRESRTSKSVVPPTVIDQIRLYEHERKRISYKPAVLISGIEDPLEYAFVKQRAQVADILLWSNDKKMLVALKKSKFDAFKPVLQERKKRMQLERDASI